MQLCLFTVGASWVRMRPDPPEARDVRLLLLQAYPDLYDGRLEVANELGWRIIRLTRGLEQYYCVFGSFRQMHDDAVSAVALVTQVWLCTCDGPPKEQAFAEYAQWVYPKLDSLEVAKQVAYQCHEVMPWLFEHWFPQYIHARRMQVREDSGGAILAQKAGKKVCRRKLGKEESKSDSRG